MGRTRLLEKAGVWGIGRFKEMPSWPLVEGRVCQNTVLLTQFSNMKTRSWQNPIT